MKFLLAILFSLLSICSLGQSSESDLIKKTFEAYKTAILNDDPDMALNAVDSRTKKYYSDLLANVKNADSLKISTLSLIDKFTILALRAKASKSEILEMKNNDAFIYAINNGMVGKNSVADNSIGKVTVDGNFAKAEFIADGKSTAYYFHFYKEDEKWKLDITAMFPISNIAFKEMLDNSEKDENAFIFEILESLTGKKISSELWNPIL